MPSTHTNLLYHIIFATKNREPMISVEWRSRLHEYLGGMVRGLDGVPQGIGGVADHAHLLVGLKPTHCLSDFMRDLKKNSSVWISETIPLPSFRWQEGYAAFTVSASVKASVRQYIAEKKSPMPKCISFFLLPESTRIPAQIRTPGGRDESP